MLDVVSHVLWQGVRRCGSNSFRRRFEIVGKWGSGRQAHLLDVEVGWFNRIFLVFAQWGLVHPFSGEFTLGLDGAIWAEIRPKLTETHHFKRVALRFPPSRTLKLLEWFGWLLLVR